MRASRRSRKEREFSVPEAAAILGQLQKRISNALARELQPLASGIGGAGYQANYEQGTSGS